MRRFSFPEWLIAKYGTSFVWLKQDVGHYDTSTGEWIKGTETEVKLHGAIVPYPLITQYQSGGTFLESDRQVFCLASLPNKAKIRYQGNVYTIKDKTPYPDYANCYIYMARLVSAFDES